MLLFIEKVAIFLFIGLLLLFWYVTLRASGSPLDRFLSKINIVASVFIPIGIFLTYRIFELQYQSMRREATYKVVDRGWLSVNEKLFLYYKSCPKFVESLFFDWQRKVLGNNSNINGNNDEWQAVNYISTLIFQAWEDYLTSTSIDETLDIAWINSFLPWSNSPILRNVWSVLKSEYDDNTQEFGDYLFYMTSSYKPKNETEMNNLAKLIIESEKYKSILQKRFGS